MLFIVTLVCIAGLIALVVYALRRASYAIRGEQYAPVSATKRRKYVHQDVNAGATAASMENVLKHYAQTPAVGTYAKAAMNALDTAERKKSEYVTVLNSKFQPSTISWQKFAGAADSTQQAILRNCAAITNQVQTFDQAEFRRLDRAFNLATQGRGKPLDATAAEKRQMLLANLAELEKLKSANDQLLLELDKLAVELGKLNSLESGAETQQIIDEIRNLAQETQYYSQDAR